MPGGGIDGHHDDQGEMRTTCRVPPDCTERPPSSRWRCSPPRGPPTSQAWASTRRAPTPTARSTLPDGTVLPDRRDRGAGQRRRRGHPRRRAHPRLRQRASRRPRSSAYQRAEAVINEADKGCNLPWELIAAIGRVESDHGRFGGNALDDRGVARPGIYGIALNGKNDTQRHPRHRRRAVRRRHPLRPRRRPDAVHPLDLVGRRASTATATAPATRRTSTTRPSRPPSTSAPATTTCRRRRASGPRSTATTTPTTTSTWCWRSCRPTWTATSAPCRPRRSPPA